MYLSSLLVGIAPNILRTTQNSAFENHPTDILHDENHLYGTVLVHIIYNTVLNLTKHFRRPDVEFLKITKTQILVSHCLTDHSRKARGQTKQRTATILRHYNKLTSGMYLLGFRRV